MYIYIRIYICIRCETHPFLPGYYLGLSKNRIAHCPSTLFMIFSAHIAKLSLGIPIFLELLEVNIWF